MNYDETRKAYDAAARDVITLREQKHTADELLGKIKAIERMSDAVAAGTNAQARDALLLEALENNLQYQATLKEASDLGMAIAFAEVDLDLARYDIRYIIAQESK